MKIETSKSLNAYNLRKGNILFNNNEISIQREIKQFRIILAVEIVLLISMLSSILSYVEKGYQRSLIITIILLILLIAILAIEIPKYIKACKMNGRTYRISEIVRAKVKEKKYSIWIAFEFSDKTIDCITIAKGNNYPEFIDVLNRNNVEITRINKR
ncbi:MAG: hypothetical protein AB7S48_16975 [Bacteroidales bacterium]